MSLLFLISCGVLPPTKGLLYTKVTTPADDLEVESLANASSEKTGKATCTCILGLVAMGDCSIKAAVENGKIQAIHHVDVTYESIWFIISKQTILVYGE